MRRTSSFATLAFNITVVVVGVGGVVGLGGCGDSQDPAPTANPKTTVAASQSVPGTTGRQITIGDGTAALIWGDGPDGVVLAHGTAFDAASWEDQAVLIAAHGSTVVAVEDTSTGSIAAAADYLRTEAAVDRLTLIGGSSGADSILALEPHLPQPPDSLILLSPNRVVEGLGSEPKLFISSEDEVVADVTTELAETAPGDDNVAMILPGSAHAQNMFTSDQADVVVNAILDRLTATG